MEGLPTEVFDLVMAAMPAGSRGILRFVCRSFARALPAGVEQMHPAHFSCTLAMARWAHAHGCPWNAYTGPRAAAENRLDVLQWLHAMGCPLDKQVSNHAARFGRPYARVTVLDWLLRQGIPVDPYLSADAAEAAHWDVLQWCQRNDVFVAYAIARAAKGGHLPVVMWLRRLGRPWHVALCSEAAALGDVVILQYALQNGCPFIDYDVAEVAARCGHHRVLECLHAHGALFLGGSVAACAAGGGHLGVLQWLRQIGCPWDHRVLEDAQLYGHSDVLAWAREHGCPEP